MTIFRIVLVLLAILPGGLFGLTFAQTPTPFACPITLPTDAMPDRRINPYEADATLHYGDGLWVAIPDDGVIVLTPEDEITFGPLKDWRSITVTWLREDGVEGFIEVTGERLDSESDLTPQTPLSPQRQYVRIGPVTTGLAFPGEGCWEVVGSAGDREIRFVVEVRFVTELIATPTPG